MDLKKLNKVISFAFILLIAILSFIIVQLYNNSIEWQEKAAHYNSEKWFDIDQMARTVERNGITVEGLSELKSYINGVVHSNETVMPPFNGNNGAYSFLGTYYDSFVRTILSEQLNDEEKQKGLELFKKMNTDLIKLCEYVNQIDGENDSKKEIMLLKADSKLYKQAEEKIKKFCNKYQEEINIFNSKYS